MTTIDHVFTRTLGAILKIVAPIWLVGTAAYVIVELLRGHSLHEEAGIILSVPLWLLVPVVPLLFIWGITKLFQLITR